MPNISYPLSLTGVILLVSLCLTARVTADPIDTSGNSQSFSAAVIPFTNYTSRSQAIEVVMPLIYESLGKGSLEIVPPSDLRAILRKYRIRSMTGISEEQALMIGAELNINFLILGSLDIFQPDFPYEVAVSFRILDISDFSIILATSFAASGDDYTGFFGIGRPKSIEELAERTVDRALGKLTIEDAIVTHLHNSTHPRMTVAIVPFDNLSGYQYAGEAISNIFLSELVAQGFNVIEPGAVNEIILIRGVQPRGEIDLATLAGLADMLHLDAVVTGTVGEFLPARGQLGSLSPELELSARILGASTGKTFAACEKVVKGTDGETLFGFGRNNSLGRLSQKTIGDILEFLIKDNEVVDLAGNN